MDPLLPLILVTIAIPILGVIIVRKRDPTPAWIARVVVIGLSTIVILVLALAILDALILGPPFILLG